MGVYLVVVSLVLDRGTRATGLSLACAVVPFQLLMMASINALDSARARGPIITNIGFPRALIPLAAAVTESAAFGASLLLLALMMLVYGVEPTAAVLWLPLVLALTLALAAAAAYPSALIGIWVSDLGSFVVSAIRTMFFLAPGLVALDQVTGDGAWLVKLNPLTGLFESYRDVLLYGRAPAAWQILIPLGVAAAVAAVFVPIYRREQRHLAKVA